MAVVGPERVHKLEERRRGRLAPAQAREAAAVGSPASASTALVIGPAIGADGAGPGARGLGGVRGGKGRVFVLSVVVVVSCPSSVCVGVCWRQNAFAAEPPPLTRPAVAPIGRVGGARGVVLVVGRWRASEVIFVVVDVLIVVVKLPFRSSLVIARPVGQRHVLDPRRLVVPAVQQHAPGVPVVVERVVHGPPGVGDDDAGRGARGVEQGTDVLGRAAVDHPDILQGLMVG